MSPELHLGQQVRIIELRGCMAHDRHYGSVKRARVISFGSLPDPSGRYDGVMLQDMETGARFWRPRLGWVERHGIREYHV